MTAFRTHGFDQRLDFTTPSGQTPLAVASWSDGRFVALWHKPTPASENFNARDMVARVFDKDGQAIGSEILVNGDSWWNSFATNSVEVITSSDGGFQVLWHEFDSENAFGQYTTQVRSFDSNGQPLLSGPATSLPLAEGWFLHTASEGGGGSGGSHYVGLADGGAVVVYAGLPTGQVSGSADILAVIVGEDGAIRTPAFAVATTTAGEQGAGDVAELPNGNLVFAWVDASAVVAGASNPAQGTEVKARLMLADGTPLGNEIMVNATISGNQRTPKVIALEGGGFVVAFEDFRLARHPVFGGEFSLPFLKFQVFDETGAKVGPEKEVVPELPGTQSVVAFKATVGGGFAIAWSEGSVLTNSEIFRVAMFGATGEQVGGIHQQIEPITQMEAVSDGGVLLAGSGTAFFQAPAFAPYLRLLSPEGLIAAPLRLASSEGAYLVDLALTDSNGVALFSGDNWRERNQGDVVWARVFTTEALLVVEGGDESPNTMVGGAAAEWIDGRGGDDILLGLGGFDSIVGGSGSDYIDGGEGMDTLTGAGEVIGDAGDFDLLFGRAGDDLLSAGGSGRVYADGGEGDDTLIGGDWLSSAGDTADYLFGGQGSDHISGGGGNDVLVGSWFGATGPTVSEAASGFDLLRGGAGDDWLLQGDFGAGEFFGEIGNDVLVGGIASDFLYGGDGADILFGGDSSDLIDGGKGSDYLFGGGDGDLFFINRHAVWVDAVDVIFVFHTNDLLGHNSYPGTVVAYDAPGYGSVIYAAVYSNPFTYEGLLGYQPIYLPGAAGADVRDALPVAFYW